MSNPDLNRPVWLTASQRFHLRAAVDAFRMIDYTNIRIHSLHSELHLVEEKKDLLHYLVKPIVSGLRLPTDALPIHLTDAQADILIEANLIDDELSNLIKPEPLRHKKVKNKEE
jgi:hypothetical protein